MPRKPAIPRRPMPPEDLQVFTRATSVEEWVAAEIFAPTGAIHNPAHEHLIGADIAYLWAPEGFEQKMRRVAGTCEEVTFRAGGWQKIRQEEQMVGWFGRIPHFLITLDAQYASICGDAEWCALVEHELYHIGQKEDAFGAPRFNHITGAPMLGIRGHDVEEFVGVVQRYGVGHPGGKLAQLVAAANKRPNVSGYQLATACGTCLLRAA